MSLFSSTRSVLILCDEGLQIYLCSRSRAKFIEFVPWAMDGFESKVSNVIVQECKRKPIVILNDMVEQHYRKERIPKVSTLDRQNVIDRRLNISFPNYKVRAALKLSHKNNQDGDNKKGNAYLFAAMPNSDPFNKTMGAVAQSNASIVGVYLLPVEAAALVKGLTQKLEKKSRYKPVWSIFVGQHHGGGLRQIVTRNGELALTRLTPIVDTDVEPELWSKEVSNELSATMSYLARFGYKETDGLSIIVTANDSVHDLLKQNLNIDADIHMANAQDLARLAKVSIGKQDDFRYADPLHVAYLGKKSKFILPMRAPSIDRLTKPRRVASFLTLLFLAGVAVLGFMAVQNWQKSIEVQDQLKVVEQQSASLKQEYDRELEREKALGFDLLYINNSVEIYEGLQERKIKPLEVIEKVSNALQSDLRFSQVDFKLIEGTTSANGYDAAQNPQAQGGNIEALFKIIFPGEIDTSVGVDVVNNVHRDIQKALPDYSVTIAKQVADLSYTGDFTGASGERQNESQNSDFTAEILVRGGIVK